MGGRGRTAGDWLKWFSLRMCCIIVRCDMLAAVSGSDACDGFSPRLSMSVAVGISHAATRTPIHVDSLSLSHNWNSYLVSASSCPPSAISSPVQSSRASLLFLLQPSGPPPVNWIGKKVSHSKSR